MNWTATIAFGIPWILLGMRILEANIPAAIKLRRAAPCELERESLWGTHRLRWRSGGRERRGL